RLLVTVSVLRTVRSSRPSSLGRNPRLRGTGVQEALERRSRRSGSFWELHMVNISCWGTRSAVQRKGHHPRRADRAPGGCRAGEELAGGSGLSSRFTFGETCVRFRAAAVAQPFERRGTSLLVGAAGLGRPGRAFASPCKRRSSPDTGGPPHCFSRSMRSR